MKKSISTLALSLAGTLAFAGAGFVAARGMDDAPRPRQVVSFTDDTTSASDDDHGGDDRDDDARDGHGGHGDDD